MDLQSYIEKAVKDARDRRMVNSDQLTLGELISKIEPIAAKQKEVIEKYKEEADVRYDFEYLFPTDIDSWRGSYNELALNFKTDGKGMYVTDFLKMLKETIGKKFTGYKGGEYIMDESTPIWVANNGNSGNTALIDVVDNEYQVILITGLREF
ncbi:MAG: hypothetical protein KBA90_13200 [Chitinophagaceae bacterium]|nr:hypothetical protein [Chitinophagaceae bacterium]